MESFNPSRLEVFKGEWFVCTWKITNTGGVAFAKGTKLARVRYGSFRIRNKFYDEESIGWSRIQARCCLSSEEFSTFG